MTMAIAIATAIARQKVHGDNLIALYGM